MEEKKVAKINLSTFFLIIAVIAIIVMGVFIYKLNNDKTIEIQKSADLQSKVNSLNKTVNDLQEKINVLSKTINPDAEYIYYASASNSAHSEYTEITSNLSNDDIFFVAGADKNNDGTYTLNGVLYTVFTLTKVELENAVNTGTYKYYNHNYTVKKNYTPSYSSKQYDYALLENFNNEEHLRYVAIKKDANTYCIENTTEYNKEWKLTNNYRKVNLSGDIEVVSDAPETMKVKNYFDNYEHYTPSETSHPSHCIRLNFENGKCIKVIEYVTGH